jgi:hypothetical protein
MSGESSAILIFQSDLFRPYLPDDAQVNPNVLGFELAHWLSRELATRGLPTSYPNAEDWGWFLEAEEEGVECMICCSGGEEDENVFEWRVYVMHPKKLFGKRPDSGIAGRLLQRVRGALEDATIRVTVEED